MNFETDAKIVIDALQAYYQASIEREHKVITQPKMSDIVQDLGLEGYIHEGGLTGTVLAAFIDRYLAGSTRLHHPGYMAHQVAVPYYTGSLASLIDGFTNNAMAIYEMGPAAAAIEAFVINWMLKKIGWSPEPCPGSVKDPQKGPPSPSKSSHGGGVLTHGGSLANLTALIAARGRLVPDIWEKGNPADLALLAPEGSHYSIARAAGILGIGGQSVYPIPVDPRGVVIPDSLPGTLAKLRKDGKRPIALVANACSTAVGLYDPLSEIGDFCGSENIWFHIDGAHGASALVSPKYQGLLDGAAKADSLVWDTHKLLRTPTLCAAVLVKKSHTLDTAFHQEASYLFHEKDQPGFDFIHRTVECTKAGLGLRFFTVLAALGEKRLAAYIDSRFELALGAWEFFSSQPDFECAVRPESNILCFRLQGSDNLQLNIRDRILAEGVFYISSTEFGGKRWLRLALMNPDTGTEDIKTLADHVRKAATSIR